jgi:MFS family permease
MDIADDRSRGRWMGFYQTAFFLGAASGAILGGTLTDLLGYHTTMKVHAGLTALGALIALVFLPETRGMIHPGDHATSNQNTSFDNPPLTNRLELATALTLFGVNRIVMAGMLISTFGLFLLERLGDPVQIGGQSFGVTTLTGIGLGSATLISMFAAPIAGTISDRFHNRWRAVSGGLIPGIAGLGLLGIATPLGILIGVPLTASTSGSNQGLATTLVGELGKKNTRSQRLGMLFTIGDLMSALGPLLAYALIPIIQIRGVYILAGSLYALVFFLSLRLALPIRTGS